MTSFGDIIRGGALAGGALLAVFLLGILLVEGVTASRVGLFGLIVVATGIGSGGVVFTNALLAGVGGIALLLLGFWQAAIGVFVVPVGVLVLFAAICLIEPPNGRPRLSSA